MFDCILAQISREHRVDPFSSEFIFDEQFASPRNGIILGPLGRTTILCILLRKMHRSQRQRAFPKRFDLGNRHGASGVQFTREDLAEELSEEGSVSAATVVAGSFRTIEGWILEMTGRPFREHLEWNSLKALKVVKLFYRLQKERQKSFLRLIRPVRSGRGSLEHRDRYPLFTKGHNERQVWLLADLRSYLGSELKITQKRKVETTFSDLLQRVEQRANTMELHLRLRHGHDLDAWLGAYRSAIAKIQELGDSVIRPITQDLDELMFVYVHTLPFMHFAAEYEQIVEKTLPDARITPITQEIDGLRWVQRDADGCATASEYVRIAEAARIYELGWSEGVIPSIVEKATGLQVGSDSYDLLAKRSVELLSRYFAYKKGTSDYGSIQVTLRSCIVAMCAVWLETCKETEYRPYWMGQQAQGKRILEFLDQSFLEQGSASGQSYPEAIDQIWTQRFEWMADALQGRQELGKLKAWYKVGLLKKVASYLVSLDIDRIDAMIRETFP